MILLSRYGLTFGLVAAFALAHLWPELGQRLDQFGASTIAIIGIFLLSGLSTDLRMATRALASWRCHLLIQAHIFLIIPTLVFVTAFWMPDGPLKLGVYLVAALPTTISSCVALTSAARGNSLCAIVNSVGSNVIGVALTPLLAGILFGQSHFAGTSAIASTVRDMALLALIPFAIGELLSLQWPAVREYGAKAERPLSLGLILLLILCAFSKSLDKLFEQFQLLWPCLIYLTVMHGVFMTSAVLTGKWLLRTREDRTAMFFCATQKTMAFGLPVAYAFFADSPVPIAVVVLPLVFYYLLQMVSGSILVHWMNHQTHAMRWHASSGGSRAGLPLTLESQTTCRQE